MMIVPVDYEPKEDDIAPDLHFDTVSVEYINYEEYRDKIKAVACI
jgi:hypothetical protein